MQRDFHLGLLAVSVGERLRRTRASRALPPGVQPRASFVIQRDGLFDTRRVTQHHSVTVHRHQLPRTDALASGESSSRAAIVSPEAAGADRSSGGALPPGTDGAATGGGEVAGVSPATTCGSGEASAGSARTMELSAAGSPGVGWSRLVTCHHTTHTSPPIRNPRNRWSHRPRPSRRRGVLDPGTHPRCASPGPPLRGFRGGSRRPSAS